MVCTTQEVATSSAVVGEKVCAVRKIRPINMRTSGETLEQLDRSQYKRSRNPDVRITPALASAGSTGALVMDVESTHVGDSIVSDQELSVVAPVYCPRPSPTPRTTPAPMHSRHLHGSQAIYGYRTPGTDVVRANRDRALLGTGRLQRRQELTADLIIRENVGFQPDIRTCFPDIREHCVVEQVAFNEQASPMGSRHACRGFGGTCSVRCVHASTSMPSGANQLRCEFSSSLIKASISLISRTCASIMPSASLRTRGSEICARLLVRMAIE